MKSISTRRFRAIVGSIVLILSACVQAEPVKREANVDATSADTAESAESQWRFYTAAKKQYKHADYTELARLEVNDSLLVANDPSAPARPYAKLSSTASGLRILALPEKDADSPNQQGGLLAAWRPPDAGVWDLTIRAVNHGTDVYGGDGGSIGLYIWHPGDQVDASTVVVKRIPHSREGEQPAVDIHRVIRLGEGDRVAMRLGANIDGYADRFVVDFKAIPSDQPGEAFPSRGVDGLLPTVPATAQSKGVPLRKGLFWIGTDGRWATGPYAQESIEWIRKFVPDLAVVMVNSFPDRTGLPAFYGQQQIPTVLQSFGAGYEPYFQERDAFERDWAGRDLGVVGVAHLAGKAHAISLPHPATTHAFTNLIQSGLRRGYSGYGFNDMVWMWGAGRGRTGHHPETIAAFRDALMGQDEGLRVQLYGREEKLYHFVDYFTHYLGAMPEPSRFGYDTWSQYVPPVIDQYKEPTDEDVASQEILFDLLVSYQWLRLAQRIGDQAIAEGGFFQCMPNPEDMANGVDLLFLCSLSAVEVVSEEFFRTPRYLDGAYVRMPYLLNHGRDDHETGFVVESGGGGNAQPYYADEIAYAASYELTAALEADHAEADFWPSKSDTLAAAVDVPALRKRYQQLFAYGLGFKHAYQDQVRRLPPEFISVTSRQIARPWGRSWTPWTSKLSKEGTPASVDQLLNDSGYSFMGVGEEYLASTEEPTPVLVYGPTPATEVGFESLVKLLESGKVGTAIVAAPTLEHFVGRDLRVTPFEAVFPDYAVRLLETRVSTGKLEGMGDHTEREFQLHGSRYDVSGGDVLLKFAGEPLVVRKAVGAGAMYVQLFNASDPANESLAAEVLRLLLAQHAILPHWSSQDGVVARVYRNHQMTVVGAQVPGSRDPQIVDGKRGLDAMVPYRGYDPASFAVNMEPETVYTWASLPSGRVGDATTDGTGRLKLEFHGSGHEIFFLFRASDLDSDAHIQQILQRRDELLEAVELEIKIRPAP